MHVLAKLTSSGHHVKRSRGTRSAVPAENAVLRFGSAESVLPVDSVLLCHQSTYGITSCGPVAHVRSENGTVYFVGGRREGRRRRLGRVSFSACGVAGEKRCWESVGRGAERPGYGPLLWAAQPRLAKRKVECPLLPKPRLRGIGASGITWLWAPRYPPVAHAANTLNAAHLFSDPIP